MTDAPPPGRRGGPPKRAVVSATEWLSPSMVRITFTGDDVRELPEVFADGYVKLVFGDAMRTYTIRSLSSEGMVIDFYVHGDEGLAGAWAARAQVGEELVFRGPGGEWSPRPDADWHLFVGDESAVPAIASGLDRLDGANALVFVEVEGSGHEYPLPGDVTWVYRGDAPYGEKLVEAVLAAEYPEGDVEAFVHGNAEAVRPLRRYLLGERGLPREHLSVSGYWRPGHTDEAWRASKREFNEAMASEA